MCIPHAPTNSFTSQKRTTRVKPKNSVPFNKKLLEPDPEFEDERKHLYTPNERSKSLLDMILSLFKKPSV